VCVFVGVCVCACVCEWVRECVCVCIHTWYECKNEYQWRRRVWSSLCMRMRFICVEPSRSVDQPILCFGFLGTHFFKDLIFFEAVGMWLKTRKSRQNFSEHNFVWQKDFWMRSFLRWRLDFREGTHVSQWCFGNYSLVLHSHKEKQKLQLWKLTKIPPLECFGRPCAEIHLIQKNRSGCQTILCLKNPEKKFHPKISISSMVLALQSRYGTYCPPQYTLC